MFIIFIISCIILLLTGAYYLMFKWNSIEQDYIKNENADNYLMAKEVFVRDPEAFKDVDKDGIDDIIDKKI